MIKVFVADSIDFGAVVTDIKGLRNGSEWVMREIESALRYDASGFLTVDWAAVDIPDSLRKRVRVVATI